jgi:hypothetical protein
MDATVFGLKVAIQVVVVDDDTGEIGGRVDEAL